MESVLFIEKNYNKRIGTYGEDEAVKYLEKKGFAIIARNFITKNGEIDIIAKDKDEYVFVEVKTRTSKNYGNPIDAVDLNKKKHIIKASKYFIYKYNLGNKYIRFDVIEVYINSKRCNINHLKNIFF